MFMTKYNNEIDKLHIFLMRLIKPILLGFIF